MDKEVASQSRDVLFKLIISIIASIAICTTVFIIVLIDVIFIVILFLVWLGVSLLVSPMK